MSWMRRSPWCWVLHGITLAVALLMAGFAGWRLHERDWLVAGINAAIGLFIAGLGLRNFYWLAQISLIDSTDTRPEVAGEEEEANESAS